MPRSVLTSLALGVEVFALRSRSALEHGGKKAIRVVQMWPKPQTLAGTKRDALRGQHRRRGKRAEFRMDSLEGVRHRIVFLVQDTAGGINQPTTRLHQARRCVQDRALFCR